MTRAEPPERVRWAVERLGVAPSDEILEIGCGPGQAARLVCERLQDGHLTAIDRSAVAIERASRRNVEHVAAGRVRFLCVALAELDAGGSRFDKAFAVNVNVFWTGPARAELEVLERVVRPGGAVHVVYDTPAAGRGREIEGAVGAAFTRHGFDVDVVTGSGGLCITATRAEGR
jgi:SAM-dependent methyltransferase